ncbi:MerR family transcriptional regulator [Streptomyces glaucosporus]|uniref:MerR family transcriptional regulator n=1 Tax=Streptomyces glaucosporus TaxID=284044 RepID=A0ABP5V9B5_9ACTN
MRIGELSRRTGVSVPTIKFYVREGLLPPGRLTSPNQAHYDEEHERRLRLIRALIGIGGLSVAAVADVLAAIDDPSRPVHAVLGMTTGSIAGHGAGGSAGRGGDRSGKGGEEAGEDGEDGSEGGGDDEETAAARAEVEALVARRGWRVNPRRSAAQSLVEAVAAMARVGHGDFFERVVEAYADAAELIARADLEYVSGRTDRDSLVEGVVVGTLLGDKVIAAMRRLAQADASARRFDDGPDPADGPAGTGGGAPE